MRLRTMGAAVLAIITSGCAVAVGHGPEVTQVGLARTARSKTSCGEYVERKVIGLDLRILTGDSGIALGWSDRLLARPGVSESGESKECWNASAAPEISWSLVESFPRIILPDANDEHATPAFLATTTAGLGIELGAPRTSVSLVYERSTLTLADPWQRQICRLRYRAGRLEEFFFVLTR